MEESIRKEPGDRDLLASLDSKRRGIDTRVVFLYPIRFGGPREGRGRTQLLLMALKMAGLSVTRRSIRLKSGVISLWCVTLPYANEARFETLYKLAKAFDVLAVLLPSSITKKITEK